MQALDRGLPAGYQKRQSELGDGKVVRQIVDPERAVSTPLRLATI